MARPQTTILDACLQRLENPCQAGTGNFIVLVGKGQVEGLNFLSDEIVNPIEFLLKLRLSREVLTHGQPFSGAESENW